MTKILAVSQFEIWRRDGLSTVTNRTLSGAVRISQKMKGASFPTGTLLLSKGSKR